MIKTTSTFIVFLVCRLLHLIFKQPEQNRLRLRCSLIILAADENLCLLFLHRRLISKRPLDIVSRSCKQFPKLDAAALEECSFRKETTSHQLVDNILIGLVLVL